MGGGSSTEKTNGMQVHERFGMIKVQEAQDPQTHEQFDTMQLSRSVQSERQLELWLKQISKIDDSQTREVLILPLKHRFQKAGMCGSTGIAYLTFEKYSFILQNQIENRYQLKKFFIESQMWYMLYNMIRAANKFERAKLKIGDIHPANIVINDDGQVKLISTLSLPNQHTNYDKIVQNISASVFLAPQELDQALIAKGEYPNVDPCRAQIFSIGLTLLSAGTLQKCNKIYDKNPFKINRQKLQVLLDSFSQKYSMLLTQTVASMIVQNPNSRKRGSDIYQMLYPYQNEILDLQPFSLPSKITTQSQLPINNYQPLYSHQSYAPNLKVQNSGYRPVQQGHPININPSSQQYMTGNRFSGNPYSSGMGKY